MKKLLLLLLSLLFLFLFIGCSANSPAITDTNLEFSICENVDGFDFSSHTEKFGLMGGREYYGTGYVPTTDENGMQTDPDACVVYTVTSYPDYSSGKRHITRISITDPAVKVWGLTLSSSDDEIRTAMEACGFARKEYQNSNGITYTKGKITVHFTDDCITVRAEVTNLLGLQF